MVSSSHLTRSTRLLLTHPNEPNEAVSAAAEADEPGSPNEPNEAPGSDEVGPVERSMEEEFEAILEACTRRRRGKNQRQAG